jgi:hypothetical protein
MQHVGPVKGGLRPVDMSSCPVNSETNRPIFHIEVQGHDYSEVLGLHSKGSFPVNAEVLHHPNPLNREDVQDLAEVSIVAGWRDLADSSRLVK